ncbi:putative disease resistance protein At1g50180 [Henckelia pumila]|uniref:putative disease resistance protein At1g50180 n=1 Tax=Henckelia pumila TaxID=405737 RepID=UPI003C6DEEDF
MATEAVVSVALETLGNLLIQEAAFLRGVSDQVEGLRVEFGRMQSLLKDADRKQHDNETIRNWIQETRYLAYRAEDVLEEYVVKFGSGNGKGFINNILNRFVCFVSEIGTLNELGSEIERIKSSITILAGHMNECGIWALITRDHEEETNSDENRLRHVDLEHFVGMNDDIKKLVSLLVSDKERCPRVICVWGMGGSGKTSVAKKVFKHVDVYPFFELFTWVTITKRCQIRSVMQDILGQLLPQKRLDIKYMTVDELGEQIYNVQIRKKCLIVFDDIWKLDDWKCLSKCFPDVRSHSKVLLTTRHDQNDVAEIGYPIIKLKGLTEDEAWKLLRRKAFAKIGFKGLCNVSEYEKLGRKMIRKCGCLPLVVAVLGGILSVKNSLEEWKIASDNVNSYIGRGEGTGEQTELEEVLCLSYDELPYHLKPCFLSLGFLQDGEGDDVENIYDIWMAEGFIQSKHVGYRETLCDVAKRYMYELQLRSMVRFDHDLSALFLHDSILDFCRSKAKEEEFLKVVDKHNNKNSGRAYRLVGYVDDHEDDGLNFLNSAENILPLRSMQIFISSSTIDVISLSKKIILYLPQFKSLTTLIIHYFELRGKCFRGIENLIHLRLLGFIRCKWERFSLESIHKLKLPFLQTLDFSGTRIISISIRKSPPPVDTFCKMRRLRRLYLPFFLSTEFNYTDRKLMRLMNLSQLETLYGFDSRIFHSNDLIHLPKLRTLRCLVNDTATLVQIVDYIRGSNLTRIYILIQLFDLDASLDALRKLLRIPSVTLELDIDVCKLSKLPRLETIDFSNMCPGLVDLNLVRVDILEDIMQELGKFPNLRRLVLWHVGFDGGEKMVCDAGSFPRLKILSFSVINVSAGNFELRIDEAAMPKLSSMQILRCSEIYVSVPQRFKHSAHTKICACERNMSVCLLNV